VSGGPDDDKAGYKRPPERTRWKKGQSGNSHRRKAAPVSEGTVAMIDRLLLAPMQITINGEASKVSTLEAIVFQILQKAMSGSARAFRTLLQYQEFANENLEKKLELTFLDSDYTQAFAAQTRSAEDA
jgi:hypothetical protein